GVRRSVVLSGGSEGVESVPREPRVAQGAYTITVGGVRALVGHTVAPFTAGFTTAPGPDVDAPVLVRSVPAAGALAVPINSAILLELSEPLDPVGAVTGGLYLYDTIGGYVQGSPSLSPARPPPAPPRGRRPGLSPRAAPGAAAPPPFL